MSLDHQQHQHEAAAAVDPAEATMTPLELLKHRMTKQHQMLHNLTAIHLNTVAAIQKDISYCMQIVEIVEQHLPDAAHHQEVAGHPSMPNAPTVQNAPTAASGLPPVRFEDPAAPRMSTESNGVELPVRQPVSMAAATEAARAAMGRVGEAVNARTAPTRAGAVPTRPTRVAPADPVAPHENTATQAAAEYHGHFFGGGSIFAKFLSPTVYAMGKGFTEPGYGGLEQYNEDVLRLNPRDLETHQWPNGFYRDAQTRLQQLLIRNNKIQVIVSNLPNTETTVHVSFAPFNERVDIKTLPIDQLNLIWSMLHAAFLAVERSAGHAPVRT
jgi:hypothetical protein